MQTTVTQTVAMSLPGGCKIEAEHVTENLWDVYLYTAGDVERHNIGSWECTPGQARFRMNTLAKWSNLG